MVSTHSRLKAAGGYTLHYSKPISVSTHSRLKAAGAVPQEMVSFLYGFNTQPPEGGWEAKAWAAQTEAVSTHSRLKAAGYDKTAKCRAAIVSTHSRLKAAGSALPSPFLSPEVSTHSRLKAAGE